MATSWNFTVNSLPLAHIIGRASSVRCIFPHNFCWISEVCVPHWRRRKFTAPGGFVPLLSSQSWPLGLFGTAAARPRLAAGRLCLLSTRNGRGDQMLQNFAGGGCWCDHLHNAVAGGRLGSTQCCRRRASYGYYLWCRTPKLLQPKFFKQI